jgi:uncharacterized protein YukE
VSQPGIRVTPAELAGVAGQVEALAGELAGELHQLRTALASSAGVALAGPGASANPLLLSAARRVDEALAAAGWCLAALADQVARAMARQAAALSQAADGYSYVERDLAAAFRLERRPE